MIKMKKTINIMYYKKDYDNYYNLNTDEKEYVKIVFEAILDKLYINSQEKDIIEEIDIMQQILKGNLFR